MSFAASAVAAAVAVAVVAVKGRSVDGLSDDCGEESTSA
jgi:hypothetical protein